MTGKNEDSDDLLPQMSGKKGRDKFKHWNGALKHGPRSYNTGLRAESSFAPSPGSDVSLPAGVRQDVNGPAEDVGRHKGAAQNNTLKAALEKKLNHASDRVGTSTFFPLFSGWRLFALLLLLLLLRRRWLQSRNGRKTFTASFLSH